MPERPERPIIIQQNQQQTQEGCCSGSGCGFIILIALVFYPFVMVSEAIRGQESWWWIPLGLVLILIEVLVVVAAVDHWLGLGLVERLNERLARANDEARPRPTQTNEVRPGPLYEPEGETDRVPGAPDRVPSVPEGEPPARAQSEAPNEVTNVYEQIRRLAKLRDEGLITPEEFEEKKRDLLGRI